MVGYIHEIFPAVSLASLPRSLIKQYKDKPHCPPPQRFRAFCHPTMSLLVDAPVTWKEHRAFNPLSSDIGYEALHGLSLGFNLQVKEHWADLAVWQERKGH